MENPKIKPPRGVLSKIYQDDEKIPSAGIKSLLVQEFEMIQN
jgi:hypothetical protein